MPNILQPNYHHKQYWIMF